MKKFVAVPFLLMLLIGFSSVEAAEERTTIAQAVTDAELYEGYFDFYYSPDNGVVLLEIDRFDEDFLYVNSLSTGLGSNDIGLDRGQIGSSRVVRWERHGDKVFLKHINLRYRAQTDNELERLAVEEAFAESILWGFTVAAESADRVLVNATDFFLNDAHGVSNTPWVQLIDATL